MLYAPVGGFEAVFDTWHPHYDFDNDDGNFYDTANPDGSGPDNPPFRPMTYDPTGASAPFPSNANGSPFWDHTGGTEYAVGDVVFPPTEDTNLNGILDGGEDGSLPTPAMVAGMPNNIPGEIDEAGSVPVHGRVYYFECVEAPLNTSSSEQPPWGSTPGQRQRMSDGYVWQVQSNLRPLTAIRITVRFLHRRSGKMRQMTLIQPLTK